MKTIALLLAGGSGTRLWPLSRQKMPKQILPLFGNKSLLQEACLRLLPLIPAEDQWIICGPELEEAISGQMNELRCDLSANVKIQSETAYKILTEPTKKNTAPAVFWAARRCQEQFGADTVLLVLPTDHFITREAAYLHDLQRGIEKAAEGYLLTFGIKPGYAETAFGYIKIDPQNLHPHDPSKVQAYIEKPDSTTVQRFIEDGSYFWNSGIFAFHVGTLLSEGKKHCPETLAPFLEKIPLELAYENAKAQSIDYALMEKTDQVLMLPASFGWSDVGSWQGFFNLLEKDGQGNLQKGNNILLDSSNCLVIGSDRLVTTVGLDSVAIIDTPDTLMVCPLDQTRRVQEIVEKLKKEKPEYL